MKIALVSVLVIATGCGSTVHRLDGELKTPAGAARNACEEEAWLVPAPTRYESVEPGQKVGTRRDDGVGLYRVGAEEPAPIPRLADELGDSPLVPPHAEAVKSYDRKRGASTAMSGLGLVAMAVGAAVFVNAFETTTLPGGEQTQQINGGTAVAGGIVFGAGFGLAIGSMILTPTTAERARAEQARYVFAPPRDDRKQVLALVDAHNRRVRARCGGSAD